MTHMALDEKTGMDPEGVRLRAAAGLEAVDFFMPGYHVWAKIIEALADVGYDANSIVRPACCSDMDRQRIMSHLRSCRRCAPQCWQHCARAEPPLAGQIGETYDWRLGVPLLEVRDGYFTRLKRSIELAHQLHDEKVRGFCRTRLWGAATSCGHVAQMQSWCRSLQPAGLALALALCFVQQAQPLQAAGCCACHASVCSLLTGRCLRTGAGDQPLLGRQRVSQLPALGGHRGRR